MKKRIVNTVPRYGDKGTGDTAMLQEALNDNGAKLKVDDHFGDKTTAELQAFQKSKGLPGTGIIPADGGKTFQLLKLELKPIPEKDYVAPPAPKGDYFGAPWMAHDNDLLGMVETNSILNARFVPGWKLSGLPGFRTLIGSKHAWCIMRTNLHLEKSGIAGTKRAGAYTLSKWGKKCPFWFGCELDIKHKGGGRHAAEFLYWIDEAKMIAATRDGNRSNKFAVFATDLSGKGDTLPSGPRWPSNHPDGQFVSKAEVLKKYPFFKVGGTGSSTR